ncbi:MAG: hypothetical protein ABIX00_03445 [Polaromonas sp.]
MREATCLPLIAIGGIYIGNARDVLRAGADSLAIVSSLCSQTIRMPLLYA